MWLLLWVVVAVVVVAVVVGVVVAVVVVVVVDVVQSPPLALVAFFLHLWRHHALRPLQRLGVAALAVHRLICCETGIAIPLQRIGLRRPWLRTRVGRGALALLTKK